MSGIVLTIRACTRHTVAFQTSKLSSGRLTQAMLQTLFLFNIKIRILKGEDLISLTMLFETALSFANAGA